jgi:sugar transferase (PEP-CTERM/EpsH1 system associated)
MHRSNRPNILVVTHRVPYPPDKGDRIRTYHILRFLSQYANIHLAALADEPVADETTKVLQKLCARICFNPTGKTRWFNAVSNWAMFGTLSEGLFRFSGLRATIRAWAKETPFVGAFASSSAMAHYLKVPELDHATKLVDVVDVDSQKWFDYAASSVAPLSWLYASEGRRLRKTERRLANWASNTTLVSTREAALFRDVTGASNVVAVTNGVDLDYYVPNPPNAEYGCVFVGAFNYRPNADAACWFARTIWPNIRHLHPQATFALVGRKPSSAVKELALIPGVEVVGQVPDVRPFLNNAAVVVAPLRLARGLQNKVLEALASGKSIVASPQALAGFDHVAELPVQRCEQPNEWIETISRLLNDPQTRQQLGTQGRAYAEKYHNWSDCLEPFGHLLPLTNHAELVGSGT